jgi:hypothetical protein
MTKRENQNASFARMGSLQMTKPENQNVWKILSAVEDLSKENRHLCVLAGMHTTFPGLTKDLNRMNFIKYSIFVDLATKIFVEEAQTHPKRANQAHMIMITTVQQSASLAAKDIHVKEVISSPAPVKKGNTRTSNVKRNAKTVHQENFPKTQDPRCAKWWEP